MPIKIHIPKQEIFDEEQNIFLNTKCDYDLILEHSLISISKWESKWHKPYLKDETKTTEQAFDYIRCMTVSPSDVEESVYKLIPQSELKKITDYINDSMTATKVPKTKNSKVSKPEILTSELMYYYMFEAGIPKDCEKWHINRLLTLITVYGFKREQADPNKKVSRSELIARNKRINEQNRRRFHTKG